MTDDAGRTVRITVQGKRLHGMKGTSEYSIYLGMKQRCYLTTCRAYKYYGGRGITVCDRWLGPDGFLRFMDDMGPRPLGKTLERTENDKGYSKENCEWVTRLRQTRNRSMTLRINGVALADLAEQAGLNYDTVYSRYRRGFAGGDLFAPIKEHG